MLNGDGSLDACNSNRLCNAVNSQGRHKSSVLVGRGVSRGRTVVNPKNPEIIEHYFSCK